LDIVAATFTIMAQREQCYNFLPPYYIDGLVVKKDLNIKSLKALSSKNISMVCGTMSRAYCRTKRYAF
jgi:ABC-type amino acid transport substrate-binding protein